MKTVSITILDKNDKQEEKENEILTGTILKLIEGKKLLIELSSPLAAELGEKLIKQINTPQDEILIEKIRGGDSNYNYGEDLGFECNILIIPE